MHRLKKMLLDQMEYEKKMLEKFEVEISDLPDGSLCLKCIKGKSYIYFQNKSLNQCKFLSSKKNEDAELIYKLRKKFFVKKSISQLKTNKKIMEKVLEKFEPFDPGAIRGNLAPVYREIQIDEFKSKMESELENWKHGTKNDVVYLPEGLKHITAKGQKVRSKSEAIIADLLDYNNILYEYERVLHIEGQRFSPDFTILRGFDQREIYWEHFGMTYDAVYRKNMQIKLSVYENAGIIPWDNLILTFESDEGNIDVSMISAIIDKMILL